MPRSLRLESNQMFLHKWYSFGRINNVAQSNKYRHDPRNNTLEGVLIDTYQVIEKPGGIGNKPKHQYVG